MGKRRALARAPHKQLRGVGAAAEGSRRAPAPRCGVTMLLTALYVNNPDLPAPTIRFA
jgi:hypothetical protein